MRIASGVVQCQHCRSFVNTNGRWWLQREAIFPSGGLNSLNCHIFITWSRKGPYLITLHETPSAALCEVWVSCALCLRAVTPMLQRMRVQVCNFLFPHAGGSRVRGEVLHLARLNAADSATWWSHHLSDHHHVST